jgi:hypothetical protein
MPEFIGRLYPLIDRVAFARTEPTRGRETAIRRLLQNPFDAAALRVAHRQDAGDATRHWTRKVYVLLAGQLVKVNPELGGRSEAHRFDAGHDAAPVDEHEITAQDSKPAEGTSDRTAPEESEGPRLAMVMEYVVVWPG